MFDCFPFICPINVFLCSTIDPNCSSRILEQTHTFSLPFSMLAPSRFVFSELLQFALSAGIYYLPNIILMVLLVFNYMVLSYNYRSTFLSVCFSLDNSNLIKRWSPLLHKLANKMGQGKKKYIYIY